MVQMCFSPTNVCSYILKAAYLFWNSGLLLPILRLYFVVKRSGGGKKWLLREVPEMCGGVVV